jgi:hypothetical protein
MSPRGERGIRFVCLLQETARQLMVFTTLRMVDRRKRDTELAALRVHPRLYVVRFVVRVGVSHPPALPIRRTAALMKPSLVISGAKGRATVENKHSFSLATSAYIRVELLGVL